MKRHAVFQLEGVRRAAGRPWNRSARSARVTVRSRCASRGIGSGVPERRFGTVDFRVLPAQFRAQIDKLCTVLADESKG